MGMELAQCDAGEASEEAMARPSVFCVGAAGVGKTTIVNRLTQRDSAAVRSAGVSCFSWKIDTKYYTANVGIWTARLESEHEEEALERLRALSEHCEALVMVFDLSNDSSFRRVKSWASSINLSDFEIILCVGNKADCVPEHVGHVEYRRRLQRRGESSSDPHPEFLEFGIQRSEGSSLLSSQDGEVAEDHLTRSRIEWCIENGIEYIETCALNDAFDDCLSLDGDLQGVSRIRGALSAHMWPGMVMKPSNKISSDSTGGQSYTQDHSREHSSDDDSDFTFEYELLSSVSDDEAFESRSGTQSTENGGEEANSNEDKKEDSSAVEEDPVAHTSDGTAVESQAQANSNEVPLQDQANGNEVPLQAQANGNDAVVVEERIASGTQANGSHTSGTNEECRLEVFERLMQEMMGMRENLRMMPDAQRREVASQVAMRMASMFMNDDDDDDDDDKDEE